MLSHKVNWILSLFGCVLIIAVAGEKSSKEASKNLMKELKANRPVKLEVRNLQSFLRGYDKNIKIFDYTVGELIGLCEETVENCHPKAYDLACKVEQEYGTTIPLLSNYAAFCRDVMMVSYCSSHLNELQESVLNSMSSEQKQLLRVFLNHLPGGNHAQMESVNKAYGETKRQLRAERGRQFDEAKFPSEFEETISKFHFMNRFSTSSLAEPASSSEEILITDWNKLCSVAGVHYETDSRLVKNGKNKVSVTDSLRAIHDT